MMRIGLTGGIGSGKSTVADMLRVHGAAVVDADVVARDVMSPDGPAYASVVERFGAGVVGADGQIDREALAAVAFGDSAALADLNALTHPVIGAEMAARLAALEGASGTATSTCPVVVVVIPLLRPAHVGALSLRAVVVVDCPTEVALERLIGERGMPEGDARARIAAQMARDERLSLADYVVDNSSTYAALTAQVAALWRWITALP